MVDDEQMICRSLRTGLSDMGYSVKTAENSKEALAHMKSFQPHVALIDMRLGGENGIDLIDKFKEVEADTEVIVMTAYSDVESAVTAIKKGAFDYINKPFALDEIGILLERARESCSMKKKLLALETQNRFMENSGVSGDSFIGNSEKMQDVFTTINILSGNDAFTVLIRGETGTGKELVADAIHRQSPRNKMPLLKINCNAIPEKLAESELFGFEKNAFSGAEARKKGLFEIADGGVVFLDELGDLSLDMQVKLLRFLDERKFRRLGGLEDIDVDVQILAATNKNLEQAVKEGSFREDLYYRLNVVPILLPPLRERDGDILLLAEYFLKKYTTAFQKERRDFGEDAKACLLSYHWPGNVRQLRNVIERIVILGGRKRIGREDLPPELRDPADQQAEGGEGQPSVCGPSDFGGGAFSVNNDFIGAIRANEWPSAIERNFIGEALLKADHNQSKTATLLGISRFSLKRRMEKHGLYNSASK